MGSFWGLRFCGESLRSGAMKLSSMLLLAVAMLGISCERHEFEGPNGTKQLNESHDSHAAPAAGHGDAHEKPAH